MNAPRPWRREPFLLFVEGYSDLVFYAEFLETLGFTEKEYFIHSLGGKGYDKLERALATYAKLENFEVLRSLAIIWDADFDSDAAFRSAQSALTNGFKELMNVSVPSNSVWQNAPSLSTRFGIHIVSDRDGRGEIETLAWQSWSADSANLALLNCVNGFTTCAGTAGIQLKSIDKVRIGAAMSVQNEDDPRLGPASRARRFNFNSEVFASLRTFLEGAKPLRQ